MQNRSPLTGILLLLLPAASLLTGCHSSDKRSQGTDTSSVLSSGPLLLLTDSIRKDPDNPHYYFERGAVLYALNHFGKAREDLQSAIRLNPREAAYYFALGEINAADGRLREAAKDYHSALQLAPRTTEARLRLAYVLFRQEQYPQALLQLDTLLGQHRDIAEAYGLRSQIFAETGDTVRALREMREAVRRQPDNYDALMAMGDLLSAGGKEAALGWYDKAYRLDTTRAEALFSKGLFYENNHETIKAQNSFQKCIATDRSYAPAYLHLGGLYEKQGDWEKAREVFNLATKVDPANAEAFYQRGQSNEKLDRPAQAQEDYRQALALDKNHAEAKAALLRLQRSQSSE